jgi:hypothetical protein
VIPIVPLAVLGLGMFLLIRKAMRVETHIIDEEGIQVAWRPAIAEATVLVNHLAAHGIAAQALPAVRGAGGRGRWVTGVGVFVEPENASSAAKLLKAERQADESGAV